jgi:hypothetical protein
LLYRASVGAVFDDVISGAQDPVRLAAAWRLAVRVAFVASALTAVVAIALHEFAHVGALPLVFGTVLAGSAIGLSLPPARPLRPAWRRIPPNDR